MSILNRIWHAPDQIGAYFFPHVTRKDLEDFYQGKITQWERDHPQLHLLRPLIEERQPSLYYIKEEYERIPLVKKITALFLMTLPYSVSWACFFALAELLFPNPSLTPAHKLTTYSQISILCGSMMTLPSVPPSPLLHRLFSSFFSSYNPWIAYWILTDRVAQYFFRSAKPGETGDFILSGLGRAFYRADYEQMPTKEKILRVAALILCSYLIGGCLCRGSDLCLSLIFQRRIDILSKSVEGVPLLGVALSCIPRAHITTDLAPGFFMQRLPHPIAAG